MSTVRRILACLICLLAVGATPASAAPAITPADMRPLAIKTTVSACAAAQFILTPHGHVKAYSCTATYVDCRWHPPMAPTAGVCVGSFRISTARPSLLLDRVCAATLFMHKSSRGVVSLLASPRWRCVDAPQTPPLPRQQIPGCASCPPPAPGPTYVMAPDDMRSTAEAEQLAACLRNQWFVIGHVRVQVARCRTGLRPFCWVGAPMTVNHGACVLAYGLTPVRSVLSNGKVMYPVKCRGVVLYKKIAPYKIDKVNIYWRCWKVNTNG